MSNYLVTGGAGFIGSHIVDTLVGDGHKVRVLDDFSSGRMSNLQSSLPQIEVINGSITDIEATRQAVDGVDYVLHHAALASVPGSIADPASTNRVNIDGTLNVLVASRDAGVKRVVFASSSAVYGNSPALPKCEDMSPDLLSPYALTKLTGEHYCAVFAQLYGLETVSLRYFNVFGPRQDPDSQYAAVIPKFITTMIQGKRPVIYGDGLQTRDFIYVRNNVAANVLACGAPDAAGHVLNIAYGEKFTLIGLVSAINQLLGTSIEPVFAPARTGDVKHSVADISKARDILHFTPSIGLTEGLDELVRWTRNCISG